ncbi:MAG: hypothetical protein LIP77_07690 [Planctomycetes bacterium]|nr:hypothetical protein [Planctomycetota bacterium]
MKKVKLNINQITAGMKLAEPITNASGVTLMPAGIRLTPMFIVRLKKWNIETLEVFVEANRKSSTNTQIPQQAVARAQTTVRTTMTAEQEQFARTVATEVSRWFLNVRDNPLMMQLRASAVRRLVNAGPDGMINILRERGLRLAAEAEASLRTAGAETTDAGEA